MGLHFESFEVPGITEYDAMRDWVKHVKLVRGTEQGRIVDLALAP